MSNYRIVIWDYWNEAAEGEIHTPKGDLNLDETKSMANELLKNQYVGPGQAIGIEKRLEGQHTVHQYPWEMVMSRYPDLRLCCWTTEVDNETGPTDFEGTNHR